MLAVERRRVIAETLRSRGVVSVAEMAGQLGTTEITVRRDLRAMAKDGLVMRARGGAIECESCTSNAVLTRCVETGVRATEFPSLENRYAARRSYR